MVGEWKQNLDINFIVGTVLTDLSEGFDWIVKLSAYGLNIDSLCCIYSYLKDRKQCVQITDKQSEFDTIISGVSQGSNFGPTTFSSLYQRPQFIILWMIIL